jgi:hypothetical protein
VTASDAARSSSLASPKSASLPWPVFVIRMFSGLTSRWMIPALPAAPTIDGQLDFALNLVPLTPEGWRSSSVASAPEHTTVAFAVAWLPEGLYVFARVEDPNRAPAPEASEVWQGDGLELYLDDDGTFAASPSYDDPGSVQLVVAAPSDATHASTRATRYRNTATLGAWDANAFATFPSESGYTLEALVRAEALDLASWALQSGQTVGFNLGVNVSPLDEELDAGLSLDGLRLGQYFLRAAGTTCDGSPFCTVEAFCTPLLIE